MNKYLLFQFLLISTFVSAQNTERHFQSANLNDDHHLEVYVNDGIYKFTPYTSKIMETSFFSNNKPKVGRSHAVVLSPSRIKTDLVETADFVIYSTSGMVVTILKSPFQIQYHYKTKSLISEAQGYVKTDSLETIQFNLDPEEILYGGGARALGMNRRGYRLQLYNKAHYGYETHSELMNYTMPIVLSSEQYMIHFDNAPIGFLDLDSKHTNKLTYETISGRMTYQIIAGDSWVDMIESYTSLTGKQPILPRWALGNFSSRFGYHSQAEAESTIQKFKDANIPVDAIILDLYWFGKDIKGTMGNLEVFRDSFPDFEGMVKRFKSKGVKTITITEPFVLTTSKRWDEAVEKDVLAKDTLGNPYKYDFYFGNTGLIDLYNPKGKKWFWDIYKDLHAKGVVGIWGDLGEPEVHPTDLRHFNATADEVHNIYGHDWAKLIFDGYAKDFPDERPFILMRAAYSGSQRFGLIPWSGDVNRSWGGLQSQPEIALQMGMQGLGYMHSDLGGFAGANLDDELYVRWLQYGVFQPIFRPHAQEEVASEPVHRSTEAMTSAKTAIDLRYKLLPYNYNVSFQNHRDGTPLMRPLFFEDANPELLTEAKTYFWGDDFLISPVLNPEIIQQDVYFPSNSKWVDFYTEQVVQGGQSKSVQLSNAYIPTYVRVGAFIPMVQSLQTTDNYDAKTLDIHYYHDPSVLRSERQFYNDDGTTADAYEKGMFELLNFESSVKKGKIVIIFKSDNGLNFMPNSKQINLIIHNLKTNPRRVSVNGTRIQNHKKTSNNQLVIPVFWDTKNTLKIKIN